MERPTYMLETTPVVITIQLLNRQVVRDSQIYKVPPQKKHILKLK